MASEEELQKAKAKLAALNAINSALTKENEELRDQLEDLRDQLDHASEPKSASGVHCSGNCITAVGA
jgi:regulator of replication initiation timing